MLALVQRLAYALPPFALLAFGATAMAADVDPFVGKYEGTAKNIAGSELKERDLSVQVIKHRDGFILKGTTTITKAKGATKRNKYAITFLPTRRGTTTVYYAAARANKFGGRDPLDPMKGDPYMWARIVGKTLFVYGMHVTDEGGYEIQTFERTLTDRGMRVTFNRTRDGTKLRAIIAVLKRVK